MPHTAHHPVLDASNAHTIKAMTQAAGVAVRTTLPRAANIWLWYCPFLFFLATMRNEALSMNSRRNLTGWTTVATLESQGTGAAVSKRLATDNKTVVLAQARGSVNIKVISGNAVQASGLDPSTR